MENVKKCLRPAGYWSGFSYSKIFFRRVFKKQSVFILMYHRVDHQARPYFEAVVNPNVFEKQIRFLKKNYKIVNLCDLKTFELNPESNRDIVVLTFDDGYYDNYIYAFPILKKYEIQATIFLTTDFINTNRLLWYDKLAWLLYEAGSIPNTSTLAKLDIPDNIAAAIKLFFTADRSTQFHILHSLSSRLKRLSADRRDNILNDLAWACNREDYPRINQRAMLCWQEIREMAEYGITFGAHTVTHPVLSELPKSQAQWEIVESKEAIENKIQKSVNSFAYPFGKMNDFSDTVIEIIKTAGFEYACTAIRGHEKFPLKDYFNLRRRGAPLTPYLFF